MSTQTISTQEEPKFYNVKILRIYTEYLKDKLKWSQREVDALFQSCNTDSSILDYDDNWFDQTLANDFHHRVAEQTGDPDIAYKVGMYTVSDSAKGIAGRLLSGFLTPQIAYKNIGRIARMYTKGSEYATLNVSKKSALIQVKAVRNCREEPYQCRNRMGMLEAVPMILQLPNAVIEHPICQHEGGENCEYHVSWIEPVGRYSLVIALATFLAAYLVGLQSTDLTTSILLGIGLAGIAYTILKLNADKRLRTALNDHIEAMRISIQTIERRNKEANLVNDISRITNRVRPMQELCNVVSQVIHEKMGYDRVSIFTVEEKPHNLKLRSFEGFDRSLIPTLLHAEFNLKSTNTEDFLVKAVNRKTPIFVRNAEEQLKNLSKRSRTFVKSLGVKSFIASPIVFEDKTFGVIAVDYKSDKYLTNNDLDLLSAISKQIAIAFANAMAYEKLKVINETLEQKVANRTAELVAARDMAIQANKSKSNFLAHVSHELRTPLQGILGYNDLMLDANASKDYRQINDNAQRVKTASTHLCNIVEGLLDFASIEADKVQFNETVFNVNSLVNEVTSTLQPLFANNQNNFTSNIASDVGYISSDYMKLKQILINLLSNANKFTRNGNVRLDISVNTLNSKSCLKIIVSDTGIGINQANLDKVFDAFVQISYGQKKQYQGTGLGLAIVKQFTKLLGGEVYVSSEENKGATFCLTIPYHPRNERDLQSSTPEPGALFTRKLSVLLADDDEMLRVLFTRFLENSGHKVETFAKGKEALHQLRQHRYDAVILDLHMPDMTGLEIIRDLDGSPNANTPIFILTADATRDIRDQTLELGATILHKPISQEQLLNRLYMVIAGDSNGSMNPTPAHRTAYGTNELLDTGMLSVLQPNDKDGTFTTNLIKIYIAQSQSLIEQFKAALSQGDLDTVWQRLHKLDGSSSSMGAFAMAKTVQHISQRVRDNKYELNTLFDEIDSVFLATCEALRTL